jgi:hypothetical protein
MFILRKMLRPILLLAVVVLTSGLVARGDEKPLTLRDIARMRHDRVPLDKIVEKASEQGVGFAVTPTVEKQLARQGFSAEQIEAIKQASGPRAKAEDGNAEKAAPIVPGQGLKSSDAERDRVLEQVTKITKLSGANVQPVATKHVTLWAPKDVQAVFVADIKKIEKFLEGKCPEPLRSGLDKRAAHLVLLKTRYDYEKWIHAMFEVMPDAFKRPDVPDGGASWKASILKGSGYVTNNFAVICMEGQEDEWLRRLAATDVGFMNFVQQVEPRRHEPLSTGFANGAESLVAGSPRVMIFSNSYHNEDRDLGNEPRAWLHVVQERMRAKKESGVRQLLSMDMSNMLLPQYAEAWTLVSVLAKQPEKFAKLVLALREEKDPLKAIEQVYGWDEKKLEAEWHKEVLGQR